VLWCFLEINKKESRNPKSKNPANRQNTNRQFGRVQRNPQNTGVLVDATKLQCDHLLEQAVLSGLCCPSIPPLTTYRSL
jgi:hypothetical protein